MADLDDNIVGGRRLLKHPGFFRTFSREGQHLFLYDPSSLPFLLEEIVASAASQLIVTAASPIVECLDDIPTPFRSRLKIVDEDGKVAQSVAAVLAPAADELRLTSLGGNRFRAPPTLDPTLRDAPGVVVPRLYDFLLGVRHKALIDIDVNRLRSSLRTLRQACTSAEARSNLAEVEGALATYHSASVPIVGLRSRATVDFSRTFQAFVQDTVYASLSRDAGLLGVPADGDHNLAVLRRHATELVEKPYFKPIAAVVEAVWKLASLIVPLPIRDLTEALKTPTYMPPIVSAADAYARSETGWTAVKPAVETVPRAEECLNAGWTEVVDAPQPTVEDFQGQSEVQAP